MTDTEKNVEREKKPAGATMFTFARFATIGVVIGIVLLQIFDGNRPYEPGIKPGAFVIIVPLIIGAIQRTNGDKEVTWYRKEAQAIGLALGLLVALTS